MFRKIKLMRRCRQISEKLIGISAKLSTFDILTEEDCHEMATKYPASYQVILGMIEMAYSLCVEKANILLELKKMSAYRDVITYMKALEECIWTMKAAAEAV